MNDALLKEMGRVVRIRGTGVVECRLERKRRLFFFRLGTLVLTQSNLKSESAERIAERLPGATAEQITLTAASIRLREAIAESGAEVVFHAEAPAPGFEPHELAALLWEATLPPLPSLGWPRSVGGTNTLARLPVDAELIHYLTELDGSRPLEDVLDFAPADPEQAVRAIAVAHVLGAIEFDPRPASSGVSVQKPVAAPLAAPLAAAPLAAPVAAPPAPRSAAADPFTVDDIADIIRGALTEAPAPEREPAAPKNTPLFGGGSATVTLGTVGSSVAPPRDPVQDRFGSALQRIREASDHFAVLGTGWQDAPETHRRSYLSLAQRLHPDRVAGEPEEVRATAGELFDKVRAAWEVLGDEARRETYIARVIRGERSDDEKAMDKIRLIMDAESDFKRGIAELNGGRLPAAHELFQRAAHVLPEDVELGAYAAFTTFKLMHGRDDAAAKEATKKIAAAVQADDKRDNTWVLYGIVLRTLGNDAAARTAFVSALKLRPSNPDALREMRRLEREKETAATESGGLFSRFFKKK